MPRLRRLAYVAPVVIPVMLLVGYIVWTWPFTATIDYWRVDGGALVVSVQVATADQVQLGEFSVTEDGTEADIRATVTHPWFPGEVEIPLAVQGTAYRLQRVIDTSTGSEIPRR
jgi:hypothetical protein